MKAVAGATISLGCAWQGCVAYRRLQHRKDLNKLRQSPLTGPMGLFRIGTTEDMLMDTLDTGDILLFNRNPLWMTPVAAVVCALRKRTSGCRFDHVAVLMCEHPGAPPLVVEVDGAQLKVTTYDERILSSDANEIVLRRLAGKRTGQTRESAATLERKLRSGDPKASHGNNLALSLDEFSLAEDVRMATQKGGGSQSAALVLRLLRHIHVLRTDQRVSPEQIAGPEDFSSEAEGEFLKGYFDPCLCIRLE